jgi:hypothetical protein
LPVSKDRFSLASRRYDTVDPVNLLEKKSNVAGEKVDLAVKK